MMPILATIEGDGIRRMKRKAESLAGGKWRKEAARGVIDAGRVTKTQVQKAVAAQMATRTYGLVSRNTRGTPKQADLAFEIWSVTGGQRIEEYKGLKSVKSGRLASPEAGGVSSAVWNAPRTFKRSFAAGSGYFATIPGETMKVAPRVLWTPGAHAGQKRDASGRFADTGKRYGPVRRLFGGSLREELGKDESLSTFLKVAPEQLVAKVMPRIAKLMKF